MADKLPLPTQPRELSVLLSNHSSTEHASSYRKAARAYQKNHQVGPRPRLTVVKTKSLLRCPSTPKDQVWFPSGLSVASSWDGINNEKINVKIMVEKTNNEATAATSFALSKRDY